MRALFVLLALAASSHACAVQELYLSDVEDTARGAAVSFARSRVEFRVKSTTRLNGRFGFYLQNKTQHDVAAVVIEHTELFIFIAFYGRQGEELVNQYSDYINGTFFEEGNWRTLDIQYQKEQLGLSIAGITNPRTTIKASIKVDYLMPLVIYPKVLEGRPYLVNYGCLDDQEFSEPSSYFESKWSRVDGPTSIYMIPGEDFRLGTLVFFSRNLYDVSDTASEHVTITREDVAVGRYNEIYIDLDNSVAKVSLQEGKRCLRDNVVSAKKGESIMFLANAPVRWIFDPRREIPYDQRIPRCNDLESKECLNFFIGDKRPSLWSSSYPLGDRMEFQVKPHGPEDPGFSIWIQELQEILAEVHLRQTSEGIELDFFQVVNGTSYHQQGAETLPDFEFEQDDWAYVYLKYDGGQLEVGLKNMEIENWQVVSGSVAIDHQLPLTASVWSRRDLHIAYDCTVEELLENKTSSLEPTTTSSPFAEYKNFYNNHDFYFLPGPDFKVASIFLLHSDSLVVEHVHSSDVVLGKWNRISMTDGSKKDQFPKIELPKKSGCRMRRTATYDVSRIHKVLFFTNTPTGWMFWKPSHSSHIAPDDGVSCARNADSVCSVQTIGQSSFRPLKYKDDMIFDLWGSDFAYPSGIKMAFYAERIVAEVEIFKVKGEKYMMYSEILGINRTLPSFHEYFSRNLEPSIRFSLRIHQTGFVDISVDRQLGKKEDWYTVRSTRPIGLYPDEYWVFLYPQGKFRSLDFEGEKMEKVFSQTMRRRTKSYVLFDNEVYVSFRSLVNSDEMSSLTFSLQNQKLGSVGDIELQYGSYFPQDLLVFLFEQHYFNTVLHPTEWNEMKLKQLGEGFLSVSLRSPSSGEAWERKLIRIYYERSAPIAPLFLQFESAHTHDIIINCHRDDGRPVNENTATEVVENNYLGPASRRLVWVNKAGTVEAPSAGQVCPLIYMRPKYLHSGLLFFQHVNGNVSTVDLSFKKDAGYFGAVYLDNNKDEEGYSRVSVPVSDEERSFKDLASRGPVEHISLYTSDPTLWMVPSCPCADVDLTKELPWNCNDFEGSEADGHASETRPAPPGDFTLTIRTTWSGTYLLVYFYHDSGEVSVRQLKIHGFSGSLTWIDVKNTKDGGNFAAVMLASEKKPHYEKLEVAGPIESVQVVSPQGAICVNIVESSCK